MAAPLIEATGLHTQGAGAVAMLVKQAHHFRPIFKKMSGNSCQRFRVLFLEPLVGFTVRQLQL